jgi:putative ABC transport system ATP-binding protein
LEHVAPIPDEGRVAGAEDGTGGVSGDPAPIVSLRGVSYLYSGVRRRQVLDDISVDIWPGEIVIVVGPSGSGKTTLLTLIGALRTVQSGSLRVLGRELFGASVKGLVEVRRKIGFIFQTHHLLDSLTAVENVHAALGALSYPRDKGRQESIAMLSAVGLGNKLDRLPGELSTGQCQRVAIARALVKRPKLVLADEPTASLDRASGRAAVELLRQLARRQGSAIVLVTHDSRILDLADRNLTLEDGKLTSELSAVRPESAHLLTALGHIGDREGLHALWRALSDPDLIEVLQRLRSEAEQLLNLREFEHTGPGGELFRAIRDSLLQRISLSIGADRASLRLGSPETPNVVSPDEEGVDDSLTMILRNRADERLGEVKFAASGRRFTEMDRRALMDFERALGSIAEVCQSLENEPDGGRHILNLG